MKKTFISLLFFLLVVPLTAAATDKEAKALYETKGDSEATKDRFSEVNDERKSEWKKTNETVREENKDIEAAHRTAASETVKRTKIAHQETVRVVRRINGWFCDQGRKVGGFFSGNSKKNAEIARDTKKEVEN